MENNNLKKIYSSIARARKFLGSSIEEINPNIVLEIFHEKNPKLFGVKNTKVIPDSFLKILKDLGYYFHTIDSSSDRGRAIDINLKNPLTGRAMTGSSSGTAINTLYGINNIGVGTDGGGSVLAPALSLNLYSILYKGVGVCGSKSKKSTDNIEFTPGVGVISQYFQDIEVVTEKLLEEKYKEKSINNSQRKSPQYIKILLLNRLDCEIKDILKENNINFHEKNIELPHSREELIKLTQELTREYDVVIYNEELIDVNGFGDSVFGTMGGVASEIQERANKKIIKVINMINGSALTLPLHEVSTGVVIFGREGESSLENILSLGKILNRERRTELFKKYFLDYSLQEIDSRWF